MYRYDHIDGGLGVAGISALVPTPEFEAFTDELAQLGGRGIARVGRLRRGEDIAAYDSGFYVVELHPEFDVLRAGGPLGTIVLSSRPVKERGLPPKLEGFNDGQLTQLAGDSAIRLAQLSEMRDLEIQITQENPYYRVAVPYSD
jgi:hypothetical protein